jgi:hypothetical protein
MAFSQTFDFIKPSYFGSTPNCRSGSRILLNLELESSLHQVYTNSSILRSWYGDGPELVWRVFFRYE